MDLRISQWIIELSETTHASKLEGNTTIVIKIVDVRSKIDASTISQPMPLAPRDFYAFSFFLLWYAVEAYEGTPFPETVTIQGEFSCGLSLHYGLLLPY